MISTKDRAKLRGLAQKQEPLVLIGKGGITSSVLDSISILLDKRELIKIRLLQNSGLDSKQASNQICENLGADGVQCIGNVLVVYRRSNRDDIKHIL
ncbi:MAG: YhbY family RNA-binding protein [Christensenellales bacterium]